jgi:DNA-binding transcriptional regulator YiaG
MKPGSKYYPIYERLAEYETDSITVNLSDIENWIGGPLPTSAKTDSGWWSNRSKGGHQSHAWIDAGYHTEDVDLKQQTITFKKYEAKYTVVQRIDGQIYGDQAAIRARRQHMSLTQAQFAEAMGVRRQTISEWENGVYLPDRSTMKHLALVAEKEAFDPPGPEAVEETAVEDAK